jgi:hypothetical protein
VCNFVVGDGFGGGAASQTNTGSFYDSGLECAEAVRTRYPLANGVTYGPGGVCWAEFGMHSSNPAWPAWRTCLYGGWPSTPP